MVETSVNGLGIGAQFLDEAGTVAEFFQCAGDRRLAAVAFDVDVEHIFPTTAAETARRARFQPGHRYAVVGEWRQKLIDGAWPILRRADQGGAIRSGDSGIMLGNDHESRRVVRIVLDVGGKNRQSVELSLIHI